jgi:hypothetical protein
MVMKDMAVIAAALTEACVTLEETVPGWERTRQWKRLSKALGLYDYWQQVVEESKQEDE